MTTVLLVSLIALDLALLGALFWQRRRHGDARLEMVAELTEERRLLAELRTAVQEELDAAHRKSKETLATAARLAAEAEHEVKNGGASITAEIDAVTADLASRFEAPLKELTRKQNALETLLRRVESERAALVKVIGRGEKICRFFDERLPYEEVLKEISDKKYADARALLARGRAPGAVAQELGLSEPEVRLIGGLVGNP